MKILITGGAGFIGSAVVRQYIRETDVEVIVVDKLTYASNLAALADVVHSPRCHFEQADICDSVRIKQILKRHEPDGVMHLAAESHVDRSIDGPAEFIQTNIVGTCTLLEAVRDFLSSRPKAKWNQFRFHHVSTDEVFGSLGETGLFTEDSQYRPNSPYSASKASADHLVRAWGHTFGLPVVTSNCSNNYGPYQFPEKLIPLMVMKGMAGQPLPLYGDGGNVRDWLYVEDHARALRQVIQQGRPGETYNIGGSSEKTNLEVLNAICALLDEMLPDSQHKPHSLLITLVPDRPGHDRRYAIDSTKIQRELGWTPRETFASGLAKTVAWYLDAQNRDTVRSHSDYAGQRLGLRKAA